MATRLIIDGNSVYEIDEECLRRKQGRTVQMQNAGRNMRYQRQEQKETERKERE